METTEESDRRTILARSVMPEAVAPELFCSTIKVLLSEKVGTEKYGQL